MAAYLFFLLLLCTSLGLGAQQSPALAPTGSALRSRELGETALKDGIFVLAEEYFKDYAKKSQEVGADFDYLDACLLLADTYCRAGKTIPARNEIDRLKKGYSGQFAENPALERILHFLDASAMIMESRNVEAIEKLSAVKASLPPGTQLSLPVLDRLGLALVKERRWREAEEVYAAIAAAPEEAGGSRSDSARSYMNLCMLMRGDVGALKAIAESKLDGPPPMSSRLAKLLLLMREERLKEAFDYFGEQRAVIPAELRGVWYFACVELARTMMLAGMKTEAAKLFEDAKILSSGLGKSESEEPYLALADLYLESGDTEKLIDNCERFKRNFPDSSRTVEMLLRLARAYSVKFDVKNNEKMKENYFLVIARGDLSSEMKASILIEAAEKLLDAKDYLSAEEILRGRVDEIAEGSEKRANAEMMLAQALYYGGKVPDAVARLREILKKYSSIDAVRKKCLYLLILASYKGKDYASARDLIRSYMEQFPSGDKQSVEIQLYLADCEHELGRKSEAAGIYENCALMAPSEPSAPEALLKSARIHIELREFSDAERILDRIILNYSRSPSYEAAIYNKISAYVLSDDEKKLKDQKSAMLGNLKGSRSFFPAVLLIADYYSGLKKYGETIKILDEILGDPSLLQSDEKDETAGKGKPQKSGNKDWISRLVYEKSLIQHKAGMDKESLASLDILLKTHPDSSSLADAYFLRGDILSFGNEFEKAVESYKESAKIRPESEMADSALARAAECLFTMRTDKENLEEASSINRKLLEKNNLGQAFREHVQYNLGRCEEEAGNKEAALLLYHKVLTEYKNDALKHGMFRDPIWLVRSANAAAKIYRERGSPESLEVARQIYTDLADVLKIEPVEEFKKEAKRYGDALSPKK